MARKTCWLECIYISGSGSGSFCYVLFLFFVHSTENLKHKFYSILFYNKISVTHRILYLISFTIYQCFVVGTKCVPGEFFSVHCLHVDLSNYNWYM